MSSWQMFFFGGGKCPNLGVVNVRILGVVNVLLANDSQSLEGGIKWSWSFLCTVGLSKFLLSILYNISYCVCTCLFIMAQLNICVFVCAITCTKACNCVQCNYLICAITNTCTTKLLKNFTKAASAHIA